MEKAKLEGERDHAVDQLAQFKKEVCVCVHLMYWYPCTGTVLSPHCITYLMYCYYPAYIVSLCFSQMQAIIDEKERATTEALNKV